MTFPYLHELIEVTDPVLRRAVWTSVGEEDMMHRVKLSRGYAINLEPGVFAFDETNAPNLDAEVLKVKALCERLPGYLGHAWDVLEDAVRPGYEKVWQSFLSTMVVFASDADVVQARLALMEAPGSEELVDRLVCVSNQGRFMMRGPVQCIMQEPPEAVMTGL